MLAALMVFSVAEAKKCKKQKAGNSQIALFPPLETSVGQFVISNPYVNACNCSKGQAIYNIQGSTNRTVTGLGALQVQCNNTADFCMKTNDGLKFKLKFPESLLNPPILIFSYTRANGKTKNLAVVNCPVPGAGGNSSSGITYNKKAGLQKKLKCKHMYGATGTKTAPKFFSKKGKKIYPRVSAISCSGCKIKPSTRCKYDPTGK